MAIASDAAAGEGRPTLHECAPHGIVAKPSLHKRREVEVQHGAIPVADLLVGGLALVLGQGLFCQRLHVLEGGVGLREVARE